MILARLWGKWQLALYRRRQARLLRRMGFQHSLIAWEGLNISYYKRAADPSLQARGRNSKTQARDSRTTLVFLHGFLDSALTFRRLVDELGNDCEILLIDLPGFGRSKMPAIRELWHIEGIAKTTLRFLAEGLRLQRFHLITHSMGGLIAAHMTIYRDMHFRNLRIQSLHSIAPAILRFSAKDRRRIREGFYTQDLEELKGLLRDLSHKRAEMPGHSVLQALLWEWSFAGYEMLAQNTLEDEKRVFFSGSGIQALRLPVHLYWGREDRMTPLRIARRLQRALPNSELHLFRDAGHALHQENAPALAGAIRSNLNLSFALHSSIVRRKKEPWT